MRARLRGAKRRLKRLQRPRTRAIILLYHSISDARFDPWELCVHPADFAAHLELLSRRASVLPLGDLLARLDDGSLPDRSVAITFDDGYVDNLQIAKPELERYGLPATVFVTAGLVGSGASFWWDKLVELTLAPVELPRVVRLSIDGRPFSFPLGPDDRLSTTVDSARRWRFDEPSPTRRHELCKVLWRRLQPLPETARRRALDELRAQARFDGEEPCLRIMGRAELAVLADEDSIEIGAHTMTHPVLSALPIPDQRQEVEASKATLERLLDRPVTHFSYPHGGRADYTADTVDAVRHAGLRSACSTYEDWLRPGVDRFQLPRVHVPPSGGDGFARLLDFWLG